MVKRIFGFIGREIKGLHEAAYLLAIFSFFSLMLGLIRDRLLAANFGASELLDVYYASFRIPDLLFVVVTSLVSAAVLVPIFTKHLDEHDVLKKHIDSLFTMFFISIVIICAIAFIFVPQFLKLTAPGLIDGALGGQLILFTRILLLSPILLGISQLFGGIVQAYRKFALYAISPILYNVGIILGILVFYPIWGEIGLILGVCLGLVFHVLVQIPSISAHRLLPTISLKPDMVIVKKIMLLSLPRTLALTSSQIVLIVLIAIASTMSVGSISIFNFAWNLQSVPLTIIGVSYSLAAFPTLSRFFNKGDINQFMSHIVTAARHIIFWSMPVIFLFVVLRAQIVRTVLGAGAFSWEDTRLTAAALALFIVSALAQSLILLFVRGYYSAGQTKKPLLINLFSSALIVVLAFVLVHYYETYDSMRIFFENLLRVDGGLSSSVLMLPLAFSIGTTLNATILWAAFEKDFAGFSDALSRPFFQSLLASIFTSYVAYIFLQIFSRVFDMDTLVGIFSQGLFSGLIGIFAGILVLLLMKNREIKEAWETMHHKVWKARVVTHGQEKL